MRELSDEKRIIVMVPSAPFVVFLLRMNDLHASSHTHPSLLLP
jgi:hypothetical protein